MPRHVRPDRSPPPARPRCRHRCQAPDRSWRSLVKRLPIFFGVPVQQLIFVRRTQGSTESSSGPSRQGDVGEAALRVHEAPGVAALCVRQASSGYDHQRRVGMARAPCSIRRGLRAHGCNNAGPEKDDVVRIERSAPCGRQTDGIGADRVQSVVLRRRITTARSPAQRRVIDGRRRARYPAEPSRHLGAQPFSVSRVVGGYDENPYFQARTSICSGTKLLGDRSSQRCAQADIRHEYPFQARKRHCEPFGRVRQARDQEIVSTCNARAPPPSPAWRHGAWFRSIAAMPSAQDRGEQRRCMFRRPGSPAARPRSAAAKSASPSGSVAMPHPSSRCRSPSPTSRHRASRRCCRRVC